MKFTLYFCNAKKGRDGLYRQRSKLMLGIEPSMSLPRKARSGLPVSIPAASSQD